MNLVTKLGVVTLATITVVPLASVVNPSVAQAKTVKRAKKVNKKKAKTYKISKNLLRSKKKYLIKQYTAEDMGITLHQQSAKKLFMVCDNGMYTSSLNYKITKQTAKGNTLTFKLKTLLNKNQKGYNFASGSGTLKVVRTGKNSYKIPTIYRGDNNAWRINNHKFSHIEENIKPKKSRISGLKMISAKKAGHYVKYELKHQLLK
ncbi:hypothetical protein D1831_03840 [Lactiplantibacillus garii]|uniref:Uncharacterized protein n=1 Tax=Lactiplantibacillus garii TaxID=2306423 RepID=A0A426D929_9LACO|nr:hypothetical protein [Lactiplantibacillus garii]RRK11085.1 hypothetical protein D1831_03840 [Lactiplantibacillus garii]